MGFHFGENQSASSHDGQNECEMWLWSDLAENLFNFSQKFCLFLGKRRVKAFEAIWFFSQGRDKWKKNVKKEKRKKKKDCYYFKRRLLSCSFYTQGWNLKREPNDLLGIVSKFYPFLKHLRIKFPSFLKHLKIKLKHLRFKSPNIFKTSKVQIFFFPL